MPVSFDTSIQDDFEHKFLMKNEMPEEKREDIKEEHGLPTGIYLFFFLSWLNRPLIFN